MTGTTPPANDAIALIEKELAGAVLQFGADAITAIASGGITRETPFRDIRAAAIIRSGMAMMEAGRDPDHSLIALDTQIDPETMDVYADAAPDTRAHVEYLAEAWCKASLRARLQTELAIALDGLSAGADPTEVIGSMAGLMDGKQKLPDLPIIDAATWTTTDPPPHDPVFDSLFDRGDKLAIIAASKQRKSFFAMQLCICAAAGIPFLGWTPAKRFKVLIVQVEIKPTHYHRRIKHMWDSLKGPDIGSRLQIINGRGLQALSVANVAAVARNMQPDLVLFDPLYKLFDGDENAAQDMKPILAEFDRLATETGAAVCYVHHDRKGDTTQQSTQDRGSGSGVIGRDYDTCITLSPHRDNPDTAVVQVLARNYPPRDPICATWDDGRYMLDYAAAPVTGKGGRYDAAFRACINENPMATDLQIAEAIGCDRSTVYRMRKRITNV
jgi:hypothetical protein